MWKFICALEACFFLLAGYDDVETCESFLCPSHTGIAEHEAAIVEAATDFHLYGLVVTDGPFVRAVLDGLAAAAGGAIDPGQLREPTVADALRRLFGLKETLEPGSDGLFGAFRQGGPGASAAGDPGTGPEAILAALGADDRSGNDADMLEVEVCARFVACEAALRAQRPRSK